MGEATFWGALGASSLIVGTEVAFAVKLPRMLIGLIMAFGVGALISSVSFELVAPALTESDNRHLGVGLAAGSLTFFLGDRAIARLGGSKRKQPAGSREVRKRSPTGEAGEGDGQVPATATEVASESRSAPSSTGSLSQQCSACHWLEGPASACHYLPASGSRTYRRRSGRP